VPTSRVNAYLTLLPQGSPAMDGSLTEPYAVYLRSTSGLPQPKLPCWVGEKRSENTLRKVFA